MISVSNYNSSFSTSSTNTMSGITSIQEGDGIQVQNQTGPSVTIANDGVLDLEDSATIQVTKNSNGSYDINSYINTPFTLSGITLDSYAEDSTLYINPGIALGDQIISGTNSLVCTMYGNTASCVRLQTNKIVLQESDNSLSIEPGDMKVVKNGLSSLSVILEGTSTQMDTTDSITLTATSSSTSLIAPTIQVTSTGTTEVQGACNFSSIPTSPTILSLTDNSTKIPTTSWVRNLFNQSAPLPEVTIVNIHSTSTTYYIPANVLFVDIVYIGSGGEAGAQVTASTGAPNFWSGGSGGGGSVAIIHKMLVRGGNGAQAYFRHSYTLNSSSFVYCDGINPEFTLINNSDGSNDLKGGSATSTQGGAAGIAGRASAITFNTSVVALQTETFNGTAGNTGLYNQYPVAGRVVNRPWVINERGTGASSGTSYGRPGGWVTYYYLSR